MEEFMIVGLMLAGVLAMIALPIAALALSREVSRNRRLEERNAAQAGTIAGLQRRLHGQGREVPEPPRGPWHERAVRDQFDRESG